MDTRWRDRPFLVEAYPSPESEILVVRDDLIEGGSKMRFLPALTDGAAELVFGGPFCGGAPYGLSVLGRATGQRVSLFYAERGEPHARQAAAAANGAVLHWVPHGRISVVQKRAREYAAHAGARFLPLGFDLPEAEAPYTLAMERLQAELPWAPDEVYCATGSGMLARCLARVFRRARVSAVAVGLGSRHEQQAWPPNVTVVHTSYRFEDRCETHAPFPSDPYYDRKAWWHCWRQARGRALFWNVLGDI